MTIRQLLNLRPYDLLRAGNRKYHVIRISIDGPKVAVVVIPDREWQNYQKHFKLAEPVEQHGFKTEAELEGIPMPEALHWVFNLSGSDTVLPELGTKHLSLIDSITV